MNESLLPSSETPEEISREEVIAAYKPFLDQGATSPDALDLDDPAVAAANENFNRWQEQLDARGQGVPDAEYRNNLSKTMLYIDAGFADRNYLEDVLGWLMQDAQNAEKRVDDPVRAETRDLIAAAIKRVRGLLEQTAGQM